MGTFKIITQPSVEPITLKEAKAAMRVTASDDDTLITGYIKSARQFAEKYLGQRLITQVVERAYDGFPSREIGLGLWPIQSVDSIKYDNTASPVAEVTLVADTDYRADVTTTGGRIRTLTGWPSTATDRYNTVRIRMTLGYPTGSPESANVPESIKDGIKMYVRFLYEGDCILEQTAMSILAPEQTRWLAQS